MSRANANLLHSIVLATRPKTLIAAVSPIVACSAFVYSTQREFSVDPFLWALLSVLFLQASTNLYNDALDFKKGADTNRRLGPTRVTASGKMPFVWVILMGVLFSLIAVLFAVPLVQAAGTAGWIVATMAVLFAFAYTGGPFPLAYKGLGELFVMIFFGWVAVLGLGSWIYQSSRILDLWILGTQVGCYSTALISINNFRDYEEDRSNQKMTLAARWGLKFARLEVTAFLVLPLILSVYWVWQDKAGALLSLILVPTTLRLVDEVLKETPTQKTNRLLGRAAQIQLLFTIAISVGFLIW
jgi:1,4-dihydroxy-2-naphthoate octaprenyltransferase